MDCISSRQRVVLMQLLDEPSRKIQVHFLLYSIILLIIIIISISIIIIVLSSSIGVDSQSMHSVLQSLYACDDLQSLSLSFRYIKY